MRTQIQVLLFGCLTAAVISSAGARDEAQDVGSDRFAAGSSVRVDRAVAGDLFATGGYVTVDAPIRGDALVAGGNVRLAGRFDKSVYTAGGQLTVAGSVANNVRAAGGDVLLPRGTQIGGNASLAGGRIEVAGVIKGYLQATGGQVLIDGTVDGDVMAAGGRIELGPQARIGGRLRYASREQAVIDPRAQVVGGVERTAQRGSSETAPVDTARRVGRGIGWIWTVGLMVIAAALIALLPELTQSVARTARLRTGWSALAGFIALICVPVAALILMITLIGLPLGLALLLAYFALLPVGYVAAAIALADEALARVTPAAATSTGWRIGAAVVAVLVLALLARVPYIGGLVVLAALLIGFGALMLQVKRSAAAP